MSEHPENKRKIEDDALKSAGKFRGTKKAKKQSKGKDQPESPQRGASWRPNEDKEIVWLLTLNAMKKPPVRDDSKITEAFLEMFADTSRTKAATKSRVGKWREELSRSFGGVTQAEIESSGFTSYKLLAPLWMVNTTGDGFICGHMKTHFSEIKVLELKGLSLISIFVDFQVGVNAENIRFWLSVGAVQPVEGYLITESCLSQFVSYLIPEDLEFVEYFESATLKGRL